jgi:hypothetical protein
LLSNIYLNEFDQFIEKELLPKYNIGAGRPSLNPEYYQAHKLLDDDLLILQKYPELKKSIINIKHKR